MTTLVLTRHAETVWHAENRYAGRTDIALTPHGTQQADTLARWSATAHLDGVYSSTLQRSVHTAWPAARAAGLPLRQDARLREVDFGAGEGLTRAEMARRFPAALTEFLGAPATTPLPGGESGVDAVRRAMPALEEIRTRHPAGTVLVVMHSTLLRLVLCRLLGIPADAYRRVFPTVDNCALTILRVDGQPRAGLIGFNIPT